MPTAAETADAAAAATAAAEARRKAEEEEEALKNKSFVQGESEEEKLMLSEMRKITKVLDEKLDILEAFEVEARLRLSGVEEAVKTVERIASSRRSVDEVVDQKDVTVMRTSTVAAAPAASGVAASASQRDVILTQSATTAVTSAAAGVRIEQDDQMRLNSLMSSLSLLEKSLDVLYFLEFETVNEEAQIKRLISIANKIHSTVDSKDRLVTQLVERRQSLEHLEKESNMIIAKTESLKKKIRGSGEMSPTSSGKEDEQLMRTLASRIEESVNTLSGVEQGIDSLKAIEVSTEKMTTKTEKMISTTKIMSANKETVVTPIADDQALKQDEKDGHRLKLLMVTLKEISRKISMMEVMEQDASSMLSRTDVLRRRINDLEHLNLMERLQEKNPKKTKTESVAPEKGAPQSAQITVMKKEVQPVVTCENAKSVAVSSVKLDSSEEDEPLKLMTKMLKDIEIKVLIIEDMERDTNCMLSRADHLQMKTRFLEDLQKKQLVAKSEKVAQKPTILYSEQESARVSTMAEVQKMKENILEKGNASPEIEQMKEMAQDEIRHDQEVEEEIRMREMFHLKEKERQKELIKQIQLMEEIEEIQAEQEREQFYHDQEQEMKIQEKEEEHERNVEHNLALIHQTELMTQINLIQDIVMILDEVTELDSEAQSSLHFNMAQIEKHLDILDEIERGTAIAQHKVELLAARMKVFSKVQSEKPRQVAQKVDQKLVTLIQSDKPLQVAQKLDNKLNTLEDIEKSTQLAIRQTENMNDKVKRVSEKSTKDQKAIVAVVAVIDKKEVIVSEYLEKFQTENMVLKDRVQDLSANVSTISTEKKLDSQRIEKDSEKKVLSLTQETLLEVNRVLNILNDITAATYLHAEKVGLKETCSDLSRSAGKKAAVNDSNQLLVDLQKLDKSLHSLNQLQINTNLLVDQIDSLIKNIHDHGVSSDVQKQVEKISAECNKLKATTPRESVVVDTHVQVSKVEIVPKIKEASGKRTGLKRLTSTEIQDGDNHVQYVYSQIQAMGNKLDLLEAVQKATEVDVDRSEKILSRIGTASTMTENVCVAKSSLTKPESLLAILSDIETRLVNIGDLQRDKNLQSDVVEKSIGKVKSLERQLVCRFDEANKTNEKKETEEAKETNEASITAVKRDDIGLLNNISQHIISIENKVVELEKMHADLVILGSQAEVLGDGINYARQVKAEKDLKIKTDKKGGVKSEIQLFPSLEESSEVVFLKPEPKQIQSNEVVEDHLKRICKELDRVDRCLSMLDAIETATALDSDRCEYLLHRVTNLETSVRGKSEVNFAGSSQRNIGVKAKRPSDILNCLAGIEKRLLVLESIQREKGIQTEQIEASLIKLKNLERHLSASRITISSEVQVPDKVTTPDMCVEDNLEFFDDQSYIDDLFLVISTIECKLSALEKLYGDVQLLHSQAGVLKDNMKVVGRMLTAKSMDESKLNTSEDKTIPSATEKLQGKMENIAILEKEISDLLKESDMNSIGKKLDSMEEWEVVDKQSLQKEISSSTQQCMSSADLAKKRVGKGLQRTYSQETADLLAKVDGMKESVEEQKALRMLERENSLEYLDYGGTGGPEEQEAALLLERVDQGFTQIITDQSETYLMTSLKKELTPDRLESDTSLAEHEREKIHQQQLIRQIQEMQDTAVLHEQMEADERIALLDEDHKQEKEKQLQLQDQSQAMINIELMRKSVLKRQEDIQKQMDQILKALNLKQSLATAEMTGIKDDPVGDSEMMQQISLMQQDVKLIDVELGNIALKEEKVLKNYQQGDKLKPIDVMRKTISDMRKKGEAEGCSCSLTQLDLMGSCLDSLDALIPLMLQFSGLEAIKRSQSEQEKKKDA